MLCQQLSLVRPRLDRLDGPSSLDHFRLVQHPLTQKDKEETQEQEEHDRVRGPDSVFNPHSLRPQRGTGRTNDTTREPGGHHKEAIAHHLQVTRLLCGPFLESAVSHPIPDRSEKKNCQ
jgi:hypothetical protein